MTEKRVGMDSLRGKAREQITELLEALPTSSPADARDRAIAIAALSSAADDLRWDSDPQYAAIGLRELVRWHENIEALLNEISGPVHWAKGFPERLYYDVKEGVANEIRERLDKARDEGLLPEDAA